MQAGPQKPFRALKTSKRSLKSVVEDTGSQWSEAKSRVICLLFLIWLKVSQCNPSLWKSKLYLLGGQTKSIYVLIYFQEVITHPMLNCIHPSSSEGAQGYVIIKLEWNVQLCVFCISVSIEFMFSDDMLIHCLSWCEVMLYKVIITDIMVSWPFHCEMNL